MSLHFTAITLFPEMFSTIKNEGVIARAIQKEIITLETVFLREFGLTERRNVDEHPIGGGDGMVIRPDVADAALKSCTTPESFVVHLTPGGAVFSNSMAKELARKKHIVFLCGRYAGFDERVVDKWADCSVSLGDFVLSGGELPAMTMMDCIARFIPGVLGNSDSAISDSFEDGLLEAPQYTKPLEFEGQKVPEVFLSGNHSKIKKYLRQEQLIKTAKIRPDLIRQILATLSATEQEMIYKVWKNQ